MRTKIKQKRNENRRFHNQRDFDFERFIDSIYGFISPIISDEDLRLTTMFIYGDEKQGLYGKYDLPQKLKEIEGFSDEVDFLTSHELPLEGEGSVSFSITRINNAFYDESLDKDKIFKELEPSNLSQYFANLPEDAITDPKEIDFSVYPNNVHNNENFLKAELVLVHTILDALKTETGYYWPLPIIAFGDLVGMLYLVYDESKLRDEGIESLELYRKMLILNVTREYEKIVLDRKLSTFAPKPEDSLGDYKEVFYDLGKMFPKDELEKQYEFTKPAPNPRRIISQNPFLMDLGYDVYYRRFAKVYIKEANTIRMANNARRKSAIISIIVDSFAHNVGAHSLVALKWWEEIRQRILDTQIPLVEDGKPVELVLEHEIQYKELEAYARKDRFYEEMSRSDSAQNSQHVSLIDVFRKMNAKRQNSILNVVNRVTGNVLAQVPIPLDSTHSYFEFLRNKSAFWSGVTRDAIFSGRLKGWFYLIRDFLRNTLFLGTVTHSEGINTIHFCVEIVGQDGTIIETGEYAEVNLDIIRKEHFDKRYIAKKWKGSYSEYAFLRPGEKFKEIAKVLKSLDPVFLPSEMIGQQAFYTLLENTLRNIKHYRRYLDKIRDSGIYFYLSIQEVGFVERAGEGKPTKEKILYKVGTWLHHEQDMVEPQVNIVEGSKEKITVDIPVIARHTRQLKERILDRHGQVRLGGSSQDKVCAAMLMNNTFESIEDKRSKHYKRHYYPYVIPASEPYVKKRVKGNKVKDDVLHILYNKEMRDPSSAIRAIKYDLASLTYRKKLKRYKDKGIVKKYFHLWKGEDCRLIEDTFNIENDNLTRFRVVAVGKYNINDKPVEYQEAYEDLRKQGIVRIIESDKYLKSLGRDKRYDPAIAKWLGTWLSGDEDEKVGMRILKNDEGKWENIGLIELLNVEGRLTVSYHNKAQIQKRLKDSVDHLTENLLNEYHEIKLGHGKDVNEVANAICRIRSHCSFMTYIYGNPKLKFKKLASARAANVKAAKLLETVLTRIVVFDNRMHNRLPGIMGKHLDEKYHVLRDQLGIEVYPEKPGTFMKNRKHFLKDSHVLVIHLSFLESIWKNEESKVTYKEGEVKEFFEDKIKAFYLKEFKKPLPENFMLVITSGRGRGDWVKESLLDPQITFRPIEALVDAVEDGLTMKDDYQIKHNLCNMFFGS